MASFEGHPLHPGAGIPLFISAGPLKEEGQLRPFMAIEDPLACPTLTLGGFTAPDSAGNGEPDFEYDFTRRAAGNSRGLPNGGKEAIRALKEPIRILSEVGIKTIIQVTNLPHETPLDVIPELVEIAAESEPTAVEVNLSCPNGTKADGSFHPPLYRDANASREVMVESRNRVGWGVTLGAKDGPHVSSPFETIDPESVRSLVVPLIDVLDFLVGINTIAAQDFPELTNTGGKGGMSGPIVVPVARQHLHLCQEFAPDLPYLSTGGVDSQNAATEIPERLDDGAMLVGGAQEFYRSRKPHLLAAEWAVAAA